MPPKLKLSKTKSSYNVFHIIIFFLIIVIVILLLQIIYKNNYIEDFYNDSATSNEVDTSNDKCKPKDPKKPTLSEDDFKNCMTSFYITSANKEYRKKAYGDKANKFPICQDLPEKNWQSIKCDDGKEYNIPRCTNKYCDPKLYVFCVGDKFKDNPIQCEPNSFERPPEDSN